MNFQPNPKEDSTDGSTGGTKTIIRDSAINREGIRNEFELAFRSSQAACPTRILREYRENGSVHPPPGAMQSRSPLPSPKAHSMCKMDTYSSLQIASEKNCKPFSSLDNNATVADHKETKPELEEKEQQKLASKTPMALFTSLAAPQPPIDIASPPRPPASSPFSQSPAWVPKEKSARRKMAPVSRLPSKRHLLQRSNSVRSGTTSLFSKDSSTYEYAAGDELVSMSDFSESYLEDDYDEISSVETEEPPPRGGIIAIGIITPPKETPPEPKTKEQEEQEKMSEVVAKDIAEQEHDVKVKLREVGTRRVSSPAVRGSTQGSMSEAKRKARLSLTANIQPRKSFLKSLQDATIPSIEEPSSPASCAATSDSVARMGVDNNSIPPPPVAMTPRLRARKSSGLSSVSSPASRQEKIRAAMGAMGSDLGVDGSSGSPPIVVTPRLRARNSGGLASVTSPANRRGEVRASLNAMESSRALPPPQSSLMITSPPRIPRRKRSALKSTGVEDVSENDTEEEDQFYQTARKPPSLRSTTSNSSGIDLDEKTRTSIINRSSLVLSRRMRSRRNLLTEKSMERSRRNLMSEKSMERTSLRSSSLRSSRSLGSTSSALSHSSQEFAEDRADILPGVAVAAPAAPARRTTSGRPCDEKQNCRISSPSSTPARISSSSSTPARASRPSDDKEVYRHNPSASLPGAHTVTRVQREEENAGTGLCLASGECTARDQIEQEDLPFEPVMTSDVRLDDPDHEESHDLEAQAGVPVLLPGAFAISSRDQLGQTASGYDSGFEEDSVDSVVECQNAEASGDLEEPIETIRLEVPDAPVEAELYQEHYATAAQVVEEDETEGEGEKDSKRTRIMYTISGFVALVIITGVVLVVALSGKRTRISGNANTVPIVEGWSKVGSVLMGPTDTDALRFGYSVAMSGDGNRLAVGLPGFGEDELRSMGSVFIMDYNGTDFIKTQQIDGPGLNAEAGKTVALSQDGKRLAIGAPSWEKMGGYVAVYEDNHEGNWTLVGGVMTGENRNGTAFGSSLAFSSDGKILAVGDKLADSDDGNSDVGSVHVLQELNKTWTQMGKAIYGQNEEDAFGWSLSLSGDGQRFAASALGANEFTGNLRGFDFDEESSWVQVGPTLLGETERTNFGASVALSSDGITLAVGANSYSIEGKGIGVGRVSAYQFDERELGAWVPMGQPIDGSSKFDSFGTSVALSSVGDILAIGGPYNDAFGEHAGHVKVLKFDGSRWNLVGYEVGESAIEGGQFGFSIALSANASRLACAAPFTIFDGFRNDVGQVHVYDAFDEEIEEQ